MNKTIKKYPFFRAIGKTESAKKEDLRIKKIVWGYAFFLIVTVTVSLLWFFFHEKNWWIFPVTIMVLIMLTNLTEPFIKFNYCVNLRNVEANKAYSLTIEEELELADSCSDKADF
jgi:hypothetical protein